MRLRDRDISPSASKTNMSQTISPAIADLIRTRRTIHSFKPEQPAAELIEQAIELARWAPNHRLTEPWRFHVLGPQTIAAIVELNAQITAAKGGAEAANKKRQQWASVPSWVLVTCARNVDEILHHEDYAACCCAIQNFTIGLWSAGVGVKWTTGKVTRDPEFLKIVGVNPDERMVVGMLWLGYPQEIPLQARKSVDEITVRLP